MERDFLQKKKQKQNPFRILSEFSYAFVFLFACLAVTLFLYFMVKAGLTSAAFSPIARFITSPFNPIEDFSKTYPNVTTGYYDNGLLVTLLILITQVYVSRFMKRLKGRVSIRNLFLSGLLASYITAAIYWIAKGLPSTGTSIISFGLAMFLTASLVLDFLCYCREKRVMAAYLAMVSAIVAGIFAYSYVGYEIHLIGGALFVLLLIRLPGDF